MNSDSFSSAGFGTTRNTFATVTATSGSASTGLFQVQTDSGTNLPYFASVPLQTSVIGTKTPLDINRNAAALENNFGRTGEDRGASPFFSSSSFDGHPFALEIQGRYVVSVGACSVAPTINVYQCSAATMATALAAGTGGNAALVSASAALFSVAGTTTAATGTYNFLAGASFFWDSTTQILGGEYFGAHYGPAYGSTPTYATRAYTAGASVVAYTALNFFATLTYTTVASAVVKVTPLEFTLSTI